MLVDQAQLDRQQYQTIGGQQADVAGAGFAGSGSALDLLRDSASQGALTKAVGAEQGLITEAGYTEQADRQRRGRICTGSPERPRQSAPDQPVCRS